MTITLCKPLAHNGKVDAKMAHIVHLREELSEGNIELEMAEKYIKERYSQSKQALKIFFPDYCSQLFSLADQS